jgi:hypothetical protein
MIIGLSGYARCGKDTVAEYLVDNYGFKRVAFADAIKDVLLAINPYIPNLASLNDVVEVEGWETAKLSPYVRGMLQNLGVYARENWSPDFWVDVVFKSIGRQALGEKAAGENSLNRIVITDVRFPNEYETIVAKGGDVVRIMREGVAPINKHVSEIALDKHKFKHTIHNDSDLFDLHLSIENLMREMGISKL